MTIQFRKIKLIASMMVLVCLFLSYPVSAFASEVPAEVENATSYYDSVQFVAMDEGEEEEMTHLLFAKLVYDYLDDYEGYTVKEYVKAHSDLYSSEIWESSGITYEALYCSLIGEWNIMEVFDKNASTGFYGVSFEKDGQVILAFRGSEMFTEEFALDESNDWLGTDFKFALFNALSKQFKDAKDSYRRVLRLASDEGISSDNITVTGHSLGGALVAYVSIVENVRGYSYDGACGHVVDLIYYTENLNIEDFTGVNSEDDVRFCNYTDDTGCAIADLIQHTNTEALYQIDRETNVEGLVENDFIPQLADADSHIIWSTLCYEGNKIYFTPKVNADTKYTFVPDETVCIDINRNVLQAGLDQIDFGIPFAISSDGIDYEYVLGALTGIVKDGRVVLGSETEDYVTAYDEIGVSSAFSIESVIYGGAGDDYLYGYVSDDVLIGGQGNDYLDGNLGNDTYIIDDSTGNTTIYDLGGMKSTIILRDMNIRSISGLVYSIEDGSLILPTGQKLNINVAQSYDNVDIYSYDNGKLYYLGDLSDTDKPRLESEDECYVFSREYLVNKNIVMLEGDGTIGVYNEDGDPVISFFNTGEPEIGAYEFEGGKAYVNSSDTTPSILIILKEGYSVEITSEQRSDLAIGTYSDEEGVVGCRRYYYKDFERFIVDYNDVHYTDDGSGEVNWQDVLNAGISYITNIFE